jgi:esterase
MDFRGAFQEVPQAMFRIETIRAGRYTLYVETLGRPAAEACVLIPGAMQGAWGWSDGFCRPLVLAGWYVVRFDHRDIGRSSTSAPGAEYSWADLGEDVIAILDGLGIAKAHLVGHSMGGHIAQHLALAHGDRVLGLGLIASGPLGATAETGKPLTAEEQAANAAIWETMMARRDSPDPEAQLRGYLEVYRALSGSLPLDEDLARWYVTQMLLHCRPGDLRPGNPHERLMRRLGETLEERAGLLARIRVPTLVIHGERDPLALPRFARSMAETIPGARLELIPGMGHMFLDRELEQRLARLVLGHLEV